MQKMSLLALKKLDFLLPWSVKKYACSWLYHIMDDHTSMLDPHSKFQQDALSYLGLSFHPGTRSKINKTED